MAFEVDTAGLQALLQSPLVTGVVEDAPMAATLAESEPIIDAPQVWAKGFDGTGQTVVILDTGIQNNHPFFNGRVVDEACFSTTESGVNGDVFTLCPNGSETQTGTGAAGLSRCTTFAIDCSHGTHVAGIAAGGDGPAGQSFDGVARDANIIAIQVFSYFEDQDCSSSPGIQPCALTYNSDQISALNYVYNTLRLSYSITSINMSIGGGGFSSQSACDSTYAATKAVIDNLRGANIATAIASGNNYSATLISGPGCISSAIAVGATADNDRIAGYSNQNFMVDLMAPGGRSQFGSGTSINSSIPGSTYGNKSGTSMATPHVAGTWAMLREASPNATVSQLLTILRDKGVNVKDSATTGRDDGLCPCNNETYKRIDLDNALAVLLPPNLSGPANNAFTTDTTPTFTWQSVPNNLNYTIEIATDSGFSNIVNSRTQTGTSYTSSALTVGGIYYWRVRSTSDYGPLATSSTRVLNIDGGPILNYTMNGNVTLTWNSLTWATNGYEAQISRNSTFTDLVFPTQSTPDLEWDVALANDTYYWRVRGIPASGTPGAWSATQTITVDEP
jgi:subtilisin family serine protease